MESAPKLSTELNELSAQLSAYDLPHMRLSPERQARALEWQTRIAGMFAGTIASTMAVMGHGEKCHVEEAIS